MAPRIRSFFSGPLLFARLRKRPEAPTVFREFVAALERLEAKPNGSNGEQRPRATRRPLQRRPTVNGHMGSTARRIRRRAR